MAFALLGARLLLLLVFVAAATGKLRDRRAFSRTLVAFSVPTAAVTFAAIVIPLAELVVGLSLLFAEWATKGALASVALLAIFTTVAAINLRNGKAPECACFGSAATEPIGPATLVRNSGLIAIALLVALAGPGGEFLAAGTAWATSTPDERALGTGVVMLLVVIAGLNMQASRLRIANTRLASRVTTLENQLRSPPAALAQDLGAGGLPVGAPAPEFDLPRLEGDRASLASLTADGRQVVLIFLSAHCPACHELWPDIERWQRDALGFVVAEVCSGSAQAIELKVMGTSAGNVLLEGDARIAEAYAMSLKPSAVFVGPSGLIESHSVAGVAAIRALVAERTPVAHH